nr:3-mercaptopropionate dioxygenase-like [Nerophis lumbriciformis]
MGKMNFAGFDQFVNAIDEAVSQPCSDTITTELRGTLCELIRDEGIKLPNCVYQPQEDRYARRELYTSEEHGYSVIAMTWGVGQGTPIHDHCGMWCVEGVWHGNLDVVQYALLDQADDMFKFKSVGAINAGCGSAGSLIPPHEYHTIANASDDDVAVSVHVYSGAMERCNVFNPLGDNMYQRCPRELCFDQ